MEAFRSWDELTVVEQLQCEYSDFFKEVNGFRPRFMTTESWNSEAWLRAELDKLADEAKVVFAREEEEQKEAIRAFEIRVDAITACGAKTREDAVRWLADAAGADGDMEYMCYLCGLPYGYFKQAA